MIIYYSLVLVCVVCRLELFVFCIIVNAFLPLSLPLLVVARPRVACIASLTSASSGVLIRHSTVGSVFEICTHADHCGSIYSTVQLKSITCSALPTSFARSSTRRKSRRHNQTCMARRFHSTASLSAFLITSNSTPRWYMHICNRGPQIDFVSLLIFKSGPDAVFFCISLKCLLTMNVFFDEMT